MRREGGAAGPGPEQSRAGLGLVMDSDKSVIPVPGKGNGQNPLSTTQPCSPLTLDFVFVLVVPELRLKCQQPLGTG